MPEFVSWGSTPRLFKNMKITEKLDGTNGCIAIIDGVVSAQSRKRLITPKDDNFGFARWVYENAGALTDVLGYGYHYGEWYGEGIQGNKLGVDGRYFGLFHPWRYRDNDLEQVDNLTTVPWLHNEAVHGPADHKTISNTLSILGWGGSKATGAYSAPYARKLSYRRPVPEGIIVWLGDGSKHKVLSEDDSLHKWQVAQREREESRLKVIRTNSESVSHGGLNLGQAA